MTAVENFEFDKNKIYFIYATGAFPCRFIRTVNIAGTVYFCFKNIQTGFASQKNIYIQPQHIDQLFEFDSVRDYEEHFKLWEEEKEQRKYKNDDDDY